MSKTWKWILGILLVVVILGALMAVGFMWRRHTNLAAVYGPMPGYQAQPFERNWNGPMMGQAPDGWEHPRMMQRSDGWGQPMMYDRGFTPYHSGFFMFGGLVKLALFFGLLYGAYWLGRRNARIVLDAAPAAPVANPSAAPEAESAVPANDAEVESAPRKRGKKLA